MSKQPRVFSEEFELGYTYTRTTGPIIGRFLTALRDKKIVGIKSCDGSVIVPPMEFDPVTTEPLTEFVDVADTGTVQTWCWVHRPHPKHPLDKAFAWAFILLDGADVPLVHCVSVNDESEMLSGLRVQAKWVDEPVGSITDIACFVPVSGDDNG